MKYDLVFMIGRFNVLHMGHIHNYQIARTLSDNFLILVGSSNIARTHKNPLTFEERKSLISQHTVADIRPLEDDIYSDEVWAKRVRSEVRLCLSNLETKTGISPEDARVCLVGRNKDESTYYLSMFPEYDYHDTGSDSEYSDINATTIRELLYNNRLKYVENVVSVITYRFLKDFVRSDIFSKLKDEYFFYQNHKDKWRNSPYAPTFITADAVLYDKQREKILLIQRKNLPGVGLWALPGGYLDPDDKSTEACAKRELREETEIVVSVSSDKSKTFSSPSRSLRGRILTEAFLFKVDSEVVVPVLTDETTNARWIDLFELYEMRDCVFEDHYHIICTMIK